MQIADILRHKGHEIITGAPSETVEAAVRRLSARRIGALIIRDGTGEMAGILSERDIIEGIARYGASALTLKVEELMTRHVLTCRPTDSVRDIMSMITMRRIRHVPVLDGERLAGIVSIGDILKSRLDETTQEINVLRDLSIARV